MAFKFSDMVIMDNTLNGLTVHGLGSISKSQGSLCFKINCSSDISVVLWPDGFQINTFGKYKQDL